ncbi:MULTISPECIES: histidine phosphatase family protein [Paenibacillus]|uniref:histidine phosphatase family protein n=1 Tax=Paenibacillus TaxID=44249 RepID=UPI0022B9395D|nr:histidine phosphatase family protein [Paenibacillus caseinilyticus]MCZ8523964.1 phosphoglycerate mutase family protein [Paenibacillus caseinilyticus]
MHTIYLIRHSQASGQEPEAELTPLGRQQAEALSHGLGEAGIEFLVSSPYRRALATVSPLAARLGLDITTDPRLVERVLCSGDRPEWRHMLRRTFEEPELCYEGGESSRAAAARALAAVRDLRLRPGRTAALVTHGNLLALLLRSYDSTFGYEQWEKLTNPDVYRVRFQDGDADPSEVTRAWLP